MENRDRARDQGGQGQGNKPDQGGSRKPGRQTPSGTPNEGRESGGQAGGHQKGARQVQENYEYKGGRQGSGSIPNPDDQDDLESAGSFRGTAGQDSDTDDDQGLGSGQNRDRDQNNQVRNPK